MEEAELLTKQAAKVEEGHAQPVEEGPHHGTSSTKLKNGKPSTQVHDSTRKAKDEKQRLIEKSYTIERDLLRDWVKRQQLRQEANEQKSYMHQTLSGTQYSKELYRQEMSPLPTRIVHQMQSHTSDPDQLQTLTTFGKKAYQMVSKTLEDVEDRIVFQSNARDTYFKKAA